MVLKDTNRKKNLLRSEKMLVKINDHSIRSSHQMGQLAPQSTKNVQQGMGLKGKENKFRFQ